jgi:hypothetical protein
MARLARLSIVNIPHHVSQRSKYVELYALSLLGYCLMSNHVHLVVVPGTCDA